ncbi:helix-turn-helix transcriptional regulator [Nocardioides sp. GXZ039]|jgi:excisionase family DNA binding protein|uniref:helix-turn-helix transcriptional regulator n=1 Tax=Nocardioides sp. GXZ039 TaxID=3136018 RepID=UPI0030F48D41
MDTNTNLSGLEPLLTIEALAEYLDVPVTTIRDWRTDGKGPCAIRVGGRVRFAVSDVLGWLAEQREVEPGRGRDGR